MCLGTIPHKPLVFRNHCLSHVLKDIPFEDIMCIIYSPHSGDDHFGCVSGVRVTRSSVIYVCFVDRCLSLVVFVLLDLQLYMYVL